MDKPIKYPTAWSYSALGLYESCPRRYKYAKVLKLKEPKGPHMLRGIKIHNEAAKFLGSETDSFPTSCVSFRDQFYELREFNPIVEQQWAFTKDWKPTGYFAKDVYVRVIADAALEYSDRTGEVIDHKTGKRYDDDYMEQLNLFAAAFIKMFPRTTTVTTRLWYLDSGDEVIEEISKSSAMEALKELERKADVMLNDRRYVPRPSWKCNNCHWRKSNGGECEFG